MLLKTTFLLRSLWQDKSRVPMSQTVAIFPLTLAQLPALSALWQAQRAEYVRHFHPFGGAVAELQQVLGAARRDRFWGLHHSGELAGFCMLRGWDAGFARPAFGVLVGERFAGRGLAAAALQHCLAWCREHRTEKVMLTVSRENERARRIYLAAGFQPTGTSAPTGDEILELTLASTL